jgi:uncharacterized protein (DUF305 family)
LALVAVAGTLSAVLVTGCAGSASPRTEPPPATSAGSAVVTAGSRFNGTDLAWIQLMIPMNEQLLPVLALADERSPDPAVAALTARIRDGHWEELALLRELFAATGLPDGNPHAGHDMPGLVNEAKLAALAGSSGPDFDRRWRDTLREHLDQRASLAKSEQQSGVDTDTKDLARRIQQTATTHRTALDTLP